jgi:hypothetical protein
MICLLLKAKRDSDLRRFLFYLNVGHPLGRVRYTYTVYICVYQVHCGEPDQGGARDEVLAGEDREEHLRSEGAERKGVALFRDQDNTIEIVVKQLEERGYLSK